MRTLVTLLCFALLCCAPAFYCDQPETDTDLPPEQNEDLPTLASLEVLVNNKEESARRAQEEPLRYGWDLFLYVNWPALVGGEAPRGKPDSAKVVGQQGTVVWETWKNTSEVFLADGGEPASWNTPEPIPEAVQQQPMPPSDSGDQWQRMTQDEQVDALQIRDTSDQIILYQVRQAKPTFDFIRTGQIYNVQGQIQVAAGGGPIPNFTFPWQAMEVKTSWRWLDPATDADKIARYFTAAAFWPVLDDNGDFVEWKTGLMGLTGIHITSKALPKWVWITFEQVDNTQWTDVTRLHPIPEAVQAFNQTMQQALAQAVPGSKWAFYELVGVQTSEMAADPPKVDGTFVVPDGPYKGDLVLANTQIESAFQSRSSCQTCHSIASVATHAPQNFDQTLRMSFVETGVTPPYYIGPSPSLGEFVSMDFVWSLRRARPAVPSQ